MIVVAIIGILASVALPAYQNYIKKAAYSEVLISMAAVKTAIDVCYGIEADLAKCDSDEKIGEKLPSGLASGALNKIEVATNGVITATPNAYKGILTSETCVLTPSTTTAGNLKWEYSGGCVTAGYARN